LQSETLSRESRVTELHKRLSVQSPVIANGKPILTVVNSYILLVYRFVLLECGDFTDLVSDWYCGSPSRTRTSDPM